MLDGEPQPELSNGRPIGQLSTYAILWPAAAISSMEWHAGASASTVGWLDQPTTVDMILLSSTMKKIRVPIAATERLRIPLGRTE